MEADYETLIVTVSCVVTVVDSCRPFSRSSHMQHEYETDGEYWVEWCRTWVSTFHLYL